VANREMKRLKKLPSALPDHALTRNYLELLTELPWTNQTEDRWVWPFQEQNSCVSGFDFSMGI